MRRLFALARVSILYIAALLLAAGYPLMAMADTPDAVVTTTQPPAPTYTYNSTTGRWDSNTWQYNPTTGVYEPVPPPTVITPPATPAAPATTTDPAATTQTPTPTTTPTQTDPTSTTTTSAAANDTSGVNATNQVNGDATTGNATVGSNTTAGGATTGDAASTATIINNVNSAIAAGDNQKVANFTYNVLGDVNGDIMLYPMLLKSMLESGASGGSTAVSSTQNNTLTNNVNLNATSGNASVTGNTTAGNATSGSANTVVNVMNILNSMISANRSFVGTINIYGNLTGDILIAPDFIPQMIANNSSLQTPQTQATTTAVNSNDTQAIVNNISLAAQSGSAAVLDNTTAGNATTGSANTNIVLFNLSGHAIIAKDSLLVFVNVLGKWVGVIVDAPTGATSALVGNGVVSDASVAPDLTVTAKTTNAITNNVMLTAQSGDATVQNNTTAGGATTGNATASANIANISGSQLGLSDWFGVLFINVFDSWYGSFGINTSYGDPPSGPTAGGGNSSPPGVITFVQPSASSGATKLAQAGNVHKVTVINGGDLVDSNGGNFAVLGATSGGGNTPTDGGTLVPTALSAVKSDFRMPIAIGSMVIVGITALGLSRLLGRRNRGELAGLSE